MDVVVSKVVGDYVLSASLPPAATQWDVQAALVELNRLSPFAASGCRACGVGYPRVHALDCPLGPPDFLGLLRAEMDAST